MCYKQKCTSLTEILGKIPCDPPDCNGLGVCNGNGNCHCKFGYSGKSCDRPGEGGSNDSGPSGPIGENFPIWAGFIVLIVFLALVAVILFMYWKKRSYMAKHK